MNIRRLGSPVKSLLIFVILVAGPNALATTLTQNVSWLIDNPNSTAKFRIVAYGDSIYAGYNGSVFDAAKYSAPTVGAEYLALKFNADVESIRRTKSGAVASNVYNSKIVAESAYMQTSQTRVVTFEMCGNDGLQARLDFKSQTGTCNYDMIATSENDCKTYVAAAMDYINANAHPNARIKIIANLYYPGYDADNVQSSCIDSVTGNTVNLRDIFLPSLVRMNYWMCQYALEKGFLCVDNFAQFMGADYDSNGDGLIDSEALRFDPSGQSESSYVNRITGALKPTLRDANIHFVSSSTSFDYIQSDDVHPTYIGDTVSAGLLGGTNGSGPPRYASLTEGKNPVWNAYGHERMGWSLSVFNLPR